MRHQGKKAQYKLPVVSALSAALLACLSASPFVWAESDDVEFDMEAIRTRGIDPKVAQWFRQAPRFMPGETSVYLTVNGNARGKIKARFGQNGELCADEKFQRDANIISPPGFTKSDSCFDLKSAWPQTELNLDPGEERVDLVLPVQAIASSDTLSANWNHGGFAGLLNYDAQYMGSAGNVSGVKFMQLGTETGFNLGDWIVRSRETFTRFNDKDTLNHQSAYAQRSFTSIKKVLQAGQINLVNSMFGTGQVLGFQLFPENALQGNRGGAGLVEGIAESQSVVEVRQSGVLIYSTTVPSGPFRLQQFPLINTRTDLNVTLTGTNGEKRSFTVPASALLINGGAVAPGLSFGLGKMDQDGSDDASLVGTIANGWVVNPHTTLNAGLLGASPYQAGAISVDTQPFNATLLSLQATTSQDKKHGDRGASLNVTASYELSERIGLNLNASRQTLGYRELNDALQYERQDASDRAQSQFGTGISWAGDQTGTLSLSWARTTTFRNEITDYLRTGWSRQFGTLYIGASLEHDTGLADTAGDTRFYLSINVPLTTQRSVNSYLNTSRKNTRTGIRYSDRSSRDRGWSLSNERDFRHRRMSNSGNVDLVTPVSQLSGSVSHDSDNYTSWSARATGGVVAHDGGVTLSAYRISDTFGIAKVGDEAGIRLETPAGPTWTDYRGYAVIPSLNGFKRSSVQLDTRSLPKNVDIANAEQEVESARGSVSYVQFEVIRTRRVLVELKDARGNPLQHGASVFDSAGNFVTVVGEDGAVFIADADITGALDVQNSGVTLCSFSISLPERAPDNVLYESATALCH